jgi:WD40 repeat protein
VQRGFVQSAETELAQGRPDAALRRIAAGAVLSDDVGLLLDADANEPLRNALWRAGALAAQEAPVAVLIGHTGRADIAFSPDGARVVTASPDKTARLWRTVDGGEIAVFPGQWMARAAFSADGSRLYVGADHGNVAVRDGATGVEIMSLQAHTREVSDLALSPDGACLATASADGGVRLWDAATGAVVREFSYERLSPMHFPAGGLAFSADGAHLLARGGDSVFRLWDTATGAEITRWERGASAVTLSPDGRRLVIGAELCDSSGARITTLSHQSRITSAKFSPDSAVLATASDDATVRIWDATSGTEIKVLRHQSSVNGVTFSPDGGALLTASYSGAHLWDAVAGVEIKTIAARGASLGAMAFSPDGALVATSGDDGAVKIWRARGNEVKTLRGHHWVTGVSFSPDGKRAVTGAHDMTARLWDVATGECTAILKGHSERVWDVAFSPDGSRILSAANDSTARIWEVSTGRELASLRGHGSGVFAAAFSSDGARVVTASTDRTARVWDAATGKMLASLKCRGDANAVAYSPCGKHILTGSDCLQLWDATSFEEIAATRDDQRAITGVAFSPDGAHVASSDLGGATEIWTADLASRVFVLRGHTGPVHGVAYRSDGACLLTGAGDNTARIWDAATGAQLAVLAGHEDGVEGVGFSRDGALALTGSADHTARIWDVSWLRAFDGDRAVFLAAALDCGVGRRSADEKDDVRMQDAPDDLFAAMMTQMTPQQQKKVAAASLSLRTLKHHT